MHSWLGVRRTSKPAVWLWLLLSWRMVICSEIEIFSTSPARILSRKFPAARGEQLSVQAADRRQLRSLHPPKDRVLTSCKAIHKLFLDGPHDLAGAVVLGPLHNHALLLSGNGHSGTAGPCPHSSAVGSSHLGRIGQHFVGLLYELEVLRIPTLILQDVVGLRTGEGSQELQQLLHCSRRAKLQATGSHSASLRAGCSLVMRLR